MNQLANTDSLISFVRQAACRTRFFALVLLFVASGHTALANTGASVPWITYEAEAMTIKGGVVLGPSPVSVDKNVTVTNTFASEASGRQCVELSGIGQYVQFKAQAAANSLIVRYSVPDTADGVGTNYTISLYINGTFVRAIPLTSKYSWLYGACPFSNNPGDGTPRDFFDEARVLGLTINPGDNVRLQVDAGDTASFYVIDLVDLEEVAPALTEPAGYRNVMDYGVISDGIADDTIAIRNCVAAGGNIWFPPGNYLVTGDIDVPANTTIQGAGMWHTTFVGSPAAYTKAHGRVRFNGTGSHIHFADFAIVGKLNYRNDSEANDGFSEFFGADSSIARVWVEHTKTGAWIANSTGMIIDSCRIRDTIADGINLCVGVNHTTVTNCTTRNTGDDSFPIWPAAYAHAVYTAGYNVITHCTAQSPFFANGGAIYGGIGNRIEDCLFQDIPDGAGVLIAGTFPVGTNLFSGTTVVERCDLNRCGGYDPGWQWRGALTVCPQGIDITGLQISNLNISNSLSYGVQFPDPGKGSLSNASMSGVNVSGYALGVKPFHPQDQPGTNNYVDGVFAVLARNDAKGGITVSDLSVNNSKIVSSRDVTRPSGTFIKNQSRGTFTFNF